MTSRGEAKKLQSTVYLVRSSKHIQVKKQLLEELPPKTCVKDQQTECAMCSFVGMRINKRTRVFTCLIPERCWLWQTQANIPPARNRCLYLTVTDISYGQDIFLIVTNFPVTLHFNLYNRHLRKTDQKAGFSLSRSENDFWFGYHLIFIQFKQSQQTQCIPATQDAWGKLPLEHADIQCAPKKQPLS